MTRSIFTGARSEVHDGQHAVVMPEYVGDLETVDHWLTAQQALDLGQALVAAGSRALADQLRSTLYGDCETCQNTRSIQDPTKDRPWSISCPDCNATGEPTGEVPRVFGRES